jgi:hypothetical protein
MLIGSVQERDEWMAAVAAARDNATWGRVYPHEGSGPVAPFSVTSSQEFVDRTIAQALTPSSTGGAATVAMATPSSVDIESKRGGHVRNGTQNFISDTASTTSSIGLAAPPTTPITPNEHVGISSTGKSHHDRTATPTSIPVPQPGTPASDISN